MGRLFRNIGWLLSGRGFNAVLSIVYLALATRTLGLEGFGFFALVIALAQTVNGLAGFQTWQFVVRWGADERTPGEATGFAIALDLLAILIGGLLTAGLVGTATLWLPLPEELVPLALGYCVIQLFTPRSTPVGILRLNFEYGRATAAEAVQPIVRAVGAGSAALFMPTVTGFVLAWILADILTFIALWVAAARLQKVDWKTVSLRSLPRAHPGAWRFVWSTNLTGSLNTAGKQILILLVGAVGSETAAGGFRVASQLGQALVQLAQTVSKAIYPELVHAKDSAHDMARRMANMAFGAGTLAVFLTLIFGRWAMAAIAGPDFRFYWTMVILAIAGAIELVGASLESLLVSAGKAHTALAIRAVPTLLGFLLLDVAMDWNETKGAAFTVLGASALSVIGFWVAVISLSQIKITIEPTTNAKRP